MTSGARLELPVFFCPIPPVQHRLADAMEEDVLGWIDAGRFALTPQARQTLIDTKGTYFCAGITPCADVERQRWFSRSIGCWYWMVDDYHCDLVDGSGVTAAFARYGNLLLRLLESPRRPAQDDPVLAAGAQIADAYQHFATPAQFSRWIAAHAGWLLGVAHQVANTEQGRMPDVDEYLTHRMTSSGVLAVLASVEIINGPEVPARLIHSPRVQAASEMAAVLVGVDNDVISHAMEQRETTNAQNLVNVLAHHHGLPLPDAVSATMALRDTVMHRFLDLTHTLLHDHHDPALRLHITSLRNTVRSNLDWGLTAPRYARHFPHPARPDQVTHLPPTSPTTPLPYPSIAWWWTV
ncbi:terpene synthase family protein [Streptomyces sp. NPDC001107]